jgi:uncharacterized protein (DUF305 family)
MITMKLLAAGGVLGACLALGACGSSSHDHQQGSTASPSATSAPTSSSSAAPAGRAHNDADVTFASMMIPHHDQAIEMSDMLLAKSGIDPEVTALAQRIKAAQGPEVARMSGWLAGWGADPSPSSMGGMAGMGDGTMSSSDLDALEKANGDRAAHLFLTGMVEHHRGAVAMARTELGSGQDADAKKLAQDIITAQQSEIAEMTRLLGR